MTDVSARQKFPFMRLPPEIRLLIYHEVFSSDEAIGAYSAWMYTEKGPDIPPAIASFMEHQFRCIAGCAPGTYPKLNYRLFLDHLTWYPNAQLLLICRQVRMEASLMFFQCHDFSFSDAYTLCHFLRGLDTSARKSISKLGLHCYGQHRDRGVASGPNGGLYWLTIEPYQTEFNLIYALRLLRECTGLKELDISISAWELEVWVSPLNRWRNSISPSLRLTNALEVVMQVTPTMAEYGYGLRALNQETRLDWGNWRDNVIGRAREEFLECIRFSRDKDLEIRVVNGKFIPFVNGSEVAIRGDRLVVV